jgi:hypothetical protein
MTQHWYVYGAHPATPATGHARVPAAWETDGGPPGAPVHAERPLVTAPDPHADTGAPYTREYYRFARRGFHIDYFDAAEPTAPSPRRRAPRLMAAAAGRRTHHLQAVVRHGGVNRFTVAQDVVGAGARFGADRHPTGLDGALRREVMRLIRTSEGQPGGSYRLDPPT